jgi:hypothetical protein
VPELSGIRVGWIGGWPMYTAVSGMSKWRAWIRALVVLVSAASFGWCCQVEGGQQTTESQEEIEPEDTAPAADSRTQQRTDLNLLGQTDPDSGESRRNENVQFNLIDNNVLRELHERLGTTATLVGEFEPGLNYFGAEFGDSPKLMLHLTPSAGQDVHGSAYWSHQNSVFSARSFFQVGDVQPARENDYGFTFGAPVWRGGLLFVEGSQQKIRGSVNGNVLVPNPNERTPLTMDPATRALVETYLGAYPDELPNRTDINERALNTNAPQEVDSNVAGIRLDQSLGAKDRLALRYAFTSQSVDAFQLVTGSNPDTDTRAHNAHLTWIRQWTPNSVTTASAGFDRLGSVLVSEENWDGPTVATSGLSAVGPPWMIPIDRARNHFRYAGQFNQQRGNHNWSAGFELIRQQINGRETAAHRGETVFADDFGRDSITNLRLGEPSLMYLAVGDVHRGFRNWLMQFYIGDRWRVTNALSINLGLRYVPATVPNEVNHRNEFTYDNDVNNFGPYFGLAYRLPGKWGVVRGSFGLHYGEIYPATFQQIRFGPPGNREFLLPAPDLVDPLSSVAEDELVAAPYLLSPDLCTPYSQQYNFIWEFQPTANVSVQLGYVGSRSVKLFRQWETNRALPAPNIEDQTTETINLRRADTSIADLKYVVNDSRGYFDAAKATLVIRTWHGLSTDVSYWYSKALDLGSNYSNTGAYMDAVAAYSPVEFGVHGVMKGRSLFDQPHSLQWRVSYALPAVTPGAGWRSRVVRDWNVSAVVLLKTGTPFTVQSGSDAPGFGNVDGIAADRPHLLDPSVLGRTIGHPDTSKQRLPSTAFAFIEPTEQAGNLGRNTFRRGSISNVNFAVSRRFMLASDKSLTFRAEAINAFNTPQFAAPGFNVSSPNFGQITNTRNDGRTFRFLLNLEF